MKTRISAVTPTLGRTWPVMDAVGETKYEPFVTDCVGCRICMIVCPTVHEKVINPSLARIRVITRELEWIEGSSDKIFERFICRQCPGTSPCMQACPVEAIYREEETGPVLVDDQKCTRCLQCVNACPYDAIWYNKRAGKIIKCDLCGGKPKCVEKCPIKCLKIEKRRVGDISDQN